MAAVATWDYEIVPGQGWRMNQVTIPMNGPTDTQQNLTVYMNGLGTATIWTNESI